jgi:small-conductance mechanosensitive channel
MNFLTYSIFKVGSFEFSIYKIIIVVALYLLARYLLSKYRIYIKKLSHKSEWLDSEKEKSLLKTGSQIITWAIVLSGVAATGFWVIFADILGYSLFAVKGVKFTIGKLIVLIIIYLITKLVLRLLRVFLKKNIANKNWIDEGREYTIFKLAKYFIYTVAAVFAIQSIGFDINLIIGGAAALLVGIGLGMQHLFNDFISGIVLLFEGTFKVGDIIELNNANGNLPTVAKVQQIDIRTSKVITRDGTLIVVPNSKLTSDYIINWTSSVKTTRFSIKVQVAYNSDLEKVKEIMHKAAYNHADVSKNHEIIVRLEDFADYSIIFMVFFWANKTWNVDTLKSDLRFDIFKQFNEQGIKIPFPQTESRVLNYKEQFLYNLEIEKLRTESGKESFH